MENVDNLFSRSNYCHFLKLLRYNYVGLSTETSLPKFDCYTHPRQWIPPPCFTSPPQDQSHIKKGLHRAHSYPDIYDTSSQDEMEKNKPYCRKSNMINGRDFVASSEKEDEIGDKLAQLRRERELLKEAQLMVELGESLSPSVKALVQKWKNFFVDSQTRESLFAHEVPPLTLKHAGGAEKRHSSRRAERMIRDLDRSFRQAKEEEEKLEFQLKNLRRETKKARGSKKPSVKFQLRKSSSSHDYKYLALKRKYEDLRQYLTQIERETQKLRKENDVLHSALKEQNQLALKEKIEYLEREILKRNTCIKECEEEVRDFYSIREENRHLKTLVRDLRCKMEEAQRKSTDQEEQKKEETKEGQKFEEEWLDKLNRTKGLYEKAIQGYKEELNAAQTHRQSMEKRLESLIKHYEEKEERLINDYESRINTLKMEGFSEAPPSATKESKGIEIEVNKESDIVKLERIIHEREKKIEELKEALKMRPEQHLSQDHLQQQIWRKLEELLEKRSVSSVDVASISSSLKETLKICLKEIMEKDIEKDKESNFRLHKENENLKEDLMKKTCELSSAQRNLKDAEKNVEKLTSKCELLVSKTCKDTEVAQNLEALKNLPHFLKESQSKLLTLQAEYQTCLTENNVLQERLKNRAFELNVKHERIAELERRVGELHSTSKKWEREAESLDTKVDILQSQVEKKNTILEKNSTQLEERIREYTTISAQLERLREDHNREITTLKALNKDSHTEVKLRNVETQNARLEAQLNILRAEKSNCEKMCKKQVRSLEEQISQLKVRNNTLQKHLETIQTTYKSMFAMEGSIWPRSLVDLPPHVDPMLDDHHPVP